MDLLHAKYIKIVATGGDLSAATEKTLAKDQVGFSMKPEIVEHILSTHPAPKTRYEVGTDVKLKGVLGEGTLDDLVFLQGGTVTSDVYTKNQTFRTLPKYDVEVGVVRPSDNGTVKVQITGLQFIAETTLAFEQKKVTYMPFDANGCDATSVTINNS